MPYFIRGLASGTDPRPRGQHHRLRVRSSGSRIILRAGLPTMSSQWFPGLRPRSQRRVRDGFTPSSPHPKRVQSNAATPPVSSGRHGRGTWSLRLAHATTHSTQRRKGAKALRHNEEWDRPTSVCQPEPVEPTRREMTTGSGAIGSARRAKLSSRPRERSERVEGSVGRLEKTRPPELGRAGGNF